MPTKANLEEQIKQLLSESLSRVAIERLTKIPGKEYLDVNESISKSLDDLYKKYKTTVSEEKFVDLFKIIIDQDGKSYKVTQNELKILGDIFLSNDIIKKSSKESSNKLDQIFKSNFKYSKNSNETLKVLTQKTGIVAELQGKTTKFTSKFSEFYKTNSFRDSLKKGISTGAIASLIGLSDLFGMGKVTTAIAALSIGMSSKAKEQKELFENMYLSLREKGLSAEDTKRMLYELGAFNGNLKKIEGHGQKTEQKFEREVQSAFKLLSAKLVTSTYQVSEEQLKGQQALSKEVRELIELAREEGFFNDDILNIVDKLENKSSKDLLTLIKLQKLKKESKAESEARPENIQNNLLKDMAIDIHTLTDTERQALEDYNLYESRKERDKPKKEEKGLFSFLKDIGGTLLKFIPFGGKFLSKLFLPIVGGLSRFSSGIFGRIGKLLSPVFGVLSKFSIFSKIFKVLGPGLRIFSKFLGPIGLVFTAFEVLGLTSKYWLPYIQKLGPLFGDLYDWISGFLDKIGFNKVKGLYDKIFGDTKQVDEEVHKTKEQYEKELQEPNVDYLQPVQKKEQVREIKEFYRNQNLDRKLQRDNSVETTTSEPVSRTQPITQQTIITASRLNTIPSNIDDIRLAVGLAMWG